MTRIEFRVGPEVKTVDAEETDTILDTALRNRVSAPYSCLEGVCQSCLATLKQGDIEVPPGSAYDPSEFPPGQILTCQVRPRKGCELLIVEYP